MAKLLKIVAKIIGSVYEWLLIVLIAVAFAIRTSPVQTWLAERATDYLSKELETELRIEKVDIYFFDRVALDGVFIRDQKGDTLASLGSVEVVLQSFDLGGNAVTLRNIGLKNGRVGISRDSLTGIYNYQFIADYFDSGPRRKPKKEPVDLTIHSLDIDHVNITYDDNRKSYSEYGMDYDHLAFRDVKLTVDDLHIQGNNVRFMLWHLSAYEQSGLHLKRLRAGCVIGDSGILLDDVIINTAQSRIFASRFHLKMNGLEQINSFEDSVTFDAVIDSSRVNLRDVSYFAPALKGMQQRVLLKATLTQKVKDLKISGIDLRTGNRTIVRGNLLLPDFRSLDGSFLKENLEYAYIDLNDLQQLRLPDKVEERFIRLDPMIERLGYFEVKRLDLIGYWSQFVLSSKHLSTQLGTLHLDNGLLFTKLDEGGYSFERSANSDYDVYIDSFQLGKFIDNPLLGKVNGSLFMSGVVGQQDVIRLNKLDGIINSLGLNGYNYTNIAVTEGSFIDNMFKAKVDITDPHLELAFDGAIDLNGNRRYAFQADIRKADLGALHITKDPNTSLVTRFAIDMQGKNLATYSGTVNLEAFRYVEDSNTIAIPKMDLTLTRGGTDHVTIRSDVADIDLDGRIDPGTIAASLNNALAEPFPAYFQIKPIPGRGDRNSFELTMTAKKTDEVLAIFAPSLAIANGTYLQLHYDAPASASDLFLRSDRVVYDSIVVTGLKVYDTIRGSSMEASIDAAHFQLNDSLNVNNVDIDIDGENGVFTTVAQWNENQPNPSKFAWETTFSPDKSIQVLLHRSFFSVKNQLWEIQNRSELTYSENRMEIDHLVLEREEQFIAINGVLSDQPEDKITIDINALQLREFSSFINAKTSIEGNVNGNVSISTPFTTFRAEGKVQVNGLIVNDSPVGDVYSEGIWDGENQRVRMNGKLEYLKKETFDYTGYYYPYSETNNLDFKLQFKRMDLQFANAFINPEVVSDIRGNLEGEISVTGKVESPAIDGELELVNGSVKIGMLGVNFKASGPIQFDGEYSAFYIDNMPITDEEGNTASITAAINHTEFEKWNCDISVNMEDDYTRLDYRGGPMPINKFLVLNTRYKEGDIYYGRAYVTGTANIFVTEDHTSITVNARTEDGTWIDIPMYGNSEIEESTVVRFEEKDAAKVVEEKLDLSSVDLDLNFDVTPAARVRLIFNEKTGDEIIAYGESQLEIHVGANNDVKMTGTYKVDGRSYYNFVMGPVMQVFNIVSGGTIVWTGDPYNASLNLTAYNKVRANIHEIMPGLEDDNSSGTQEVRCVMYITQTLADPLITLDIQAPNATDYEQTMLNNVRSNKEELQKQFFSLLIFKKFIPLTGQSASSNEGLADLLAQQINKILAGMTEGEGLKLNVDYDDDVTNGDKTVKVGSQVALGQNSNIILKGSFGVANSTTETQSSTNLVGDMSLEYLINADGSFRVNIFNESNETGVIQDKTQGLFTQGVGLHYQEEFNTLDDFKLIQVVLDWFRKENRVKIKKRRREVEVYPDAEDRKKEQEDRRRQQEMQNGGVTIPSKPSEEETEEQELPVEKD